MQVKCEGPPGLPICAVNSLKGVKKCGNFTTDIPDLWGIDYAKLT